MIALHDLVEYQEGARRLVGYVLALGEPIAIEPGCRPGERILVPGRLVRELTGAEAVEAAEDLRMAVGRGLGLPHA